MEENTLERKKEILKMYFLVHPGYVIQSDPDVAFREDALELMERYIKKAANLKNEELMVAFMPSIGPEFIKDFRESTKSYVEAVRRIKKILGDRLIVLADSDEEVNSHHGAVFEANKETIWKKIKNIAEKRGFCFSKDLTGEAYGEIMDVCVRAVAENMHQASGMSKPIKLKQRLTDYPLYQKDPSSFGAVLMREIRESIPPSDGVEIDIGDE